MNIFQIMARLCYSFWAFIYNNVIHVMTSTFGLIFYQIYIYLPVWTQYQILQFKLHRRWVKLSISWWLIVIISKWKEPPMNPGKQVNGTYWMHVREDLYSLKADFKEIARRKRRLLKSIEYVNVFADTFLRMRFIFNLLILNSIALIFLTI